MAKITSIILGDYFDKFIQNEIKSGRYSSVSDVLRSGLRLLEIEKSKIKAINRALTVGEKSGDLKPYDNEKFKSRMRRKYKIDA